MKESIRARIAASVLAVSKGEPVHSIYVYETNSRRNIAVSVSDSGLSGYDQETSTHFTGGVLPNLDLYDSETASQVSLTVDGEVFEGHDYSSGHSFSGNVFGDMVTVRDYAQDKDFTFKA